MSGTLSISIDWFWLEPSWKEIESSIFNRRFCTCDNMLGHSEASWFNLVAPMLPQKRWSDSVQGRTSINSAKLSASERGGSLRSQMVWARVELNRAKEGWDPWSFFLISSSSLCCNRWRSKRSGSDGQRRKVWRIFFSNMRDQSFQSVNDVSQTKKKQKTEKNQKLDTNKPGQPESND